MDKKSINKQIRSISNRGSLLLLIFFAIIISVGIFWRIMYRVGGFGSIWQDEKFYLIISQGGIFFVVYPILYLVYYKLLNKKNGLRLGQVFRKPERSKGWIFKWTVITVGASNVIGILLSNIAINLMPERAKLFSEMYSVVSDNDVFSWIITIIPSVILAPIFEELVFRGTVYRNNEPMGQLFAAVVTGLAFGLWHTRIEQVFGAALMGFFVCLIFAKTRSIYPVIFVHFVNNLISTSISFLKAQLGSILSAGDKVFMVQAMFHKQPVFSVILLILALAVMALFIAGPVLLIVQIVKKRKNFGLCKGEFPYGAWKKALIFFSSPVTIIVFVGMILRTFVL